jgi:hypothetical protein
MRGEKNKSFKGCKEQAWRQRERACKNTAKPLAWAHSNVLSLVVTQLCPCLSHLNLLYVIARVFGFWNHIHLMRPQSMARTQTLLADLHQELGTVHKGNRKGASPRFSIENWDRKDRSREPRTGCNKGVNKGRTEVTPLVLARQPSPPRQRMPQTLQSRRPMSAGDRFWAYREIKSRAEMGQPRSRRQAGWRRVRRAGLWRGCPCKSQRKPFIQNRNLSSS